MASVFRRALEWRLRCSGAISSRALTTRPRRGSWRTRTESTRVRKPPESRSRRTTAFGILKRLGPGLIIAGSIVGSGELIATTLAGAEAGFFLLWLIILGCLVKVFTQVELGRYTIVSNDTAMAGLNSVPGPRAGRANWLVWYWLIMFVITLGQLGGIVGGVGQALSISAPLTDDGKAYNDYVDDKTSLAVNAKIIDRIRTLDAEGTLPADTERVAALETEIAQAEARLVQAGEIENTGSTDDRIWAVIVTAITVVVLLLGRYGLIQAFSTILVASFTVITVINLILLQSNPEWAISWDEFMSGLKFGLPESENGLFTALAAFGIIGVGATELVQYPYWCLEKGYARFTGPRDDSPEWAARANGWMRVMRWDAWCSMVVYTFATIAFYLLGAAILGRAELKPAGTELIRTLGVMYEPVFGSAAETLFLFGAVAVLYSTFFVANASHARVSSDAVRVFGGRDNSEAANRRWIRIFSALFPCLCLGVYLFYQQPKVLVLTSGVMQAIMLPMLGAGALYFRYRCCDDRIKPGRVWDAMLWISALAMLFAGVAITLISWRKFAGA